MGFSNSGHAQTPRYYIPKVEGEDYMTTLFKTSVEDAKLAGDPTTAGQIWAERTMSYLGRQGAVRRPIVPQAPQAPIKEASAEEISNSSKKRQLIRANRSVKT